MAGKLGGARPGAGRPVGAVTKVTRKRAEELSKAGETPLDVMIGNMLFWHRHANTLGARLETAVLRDDSTPDERREVMGLLRSFLAARENSQKCAVDAAPYCHPKLQSIAIKKDDSAEQMKVTMTLPPTTGDEDRSYREGYGENVVELVRKTAEG